jgi:hypothetical protein
VLAAATRRADDASSEKTMLQVFFSFLTNRCRTTTNGAPLCYHLGSHFLDFSNTTNVSLHTYIMFAIFVVSKCYNVTKLLLQGIGRAYLHAARSQAMSPTRSFCYSGYFFFGYEVSGEVSGEFSSEVSMDVPTMLAFCYNSTIFFGTTSPMRFW